MNKFAENMCEASDLADVGGSVRTEARVRHDFNTHKTIEAHLDDPASEDDHLLRNAIWTFVLCYAFEQQYGDLGFLQHVYYPRLNPRDLTSEVADSKLNDHPIIVRIPIVNMYAVCNTGQTIIGVFPDMLSAFLVWCDLVEREYRCRIRHQTTQQWTDLTSLRSKINKHTLQ